MTLDRFRSVADRFLTPWVRAADALGLSPDAVSVIAFVLALLAGVAFALAGDGLSGLGGGLPTGAPLLYLLGAVLVFFNGWLDVVDGELARRTGTESAGGDLLDHVLDRYADIVVLVGLAAGVGRYGVGLAAVTGVLMTSYLGTQAQAVGLDRVYGGLVGRADRLALVSLVSAAAAFYPDPVAGLTAVGWLLVFFAVVGHLTALQRFYHAMHELA